MLAELVRSGRRIELDSAERVAQSTQVNSHGGWSLPVLPGAQPSADGKRIVLPLPTDYDSLKPVTLIANWTADLTQHPSPGHRLGK